MRITKRQLRRIIKEEVKKVSESFFGYAGGGDISIRSDELRDAFEHRGIKVPFSLEDAGLDSNKLRQMGFEYQPHHPDDLNDPRGMPYPYENTEGFWYDPQDDWRRSKLKTAGVTGVTTAGGTTRV